MEWFTSSLQAAQQAATSLVGSDVAEKARQLAEEARQKAAAFAQEASIKAQEVAKEAMSEAERSIKELAAAAQGADKPQSSSDPRAYGITSELQQFVSSLTYITFSDFPMETLPTPEEAGNTQGRLSPWQEAHARLVLERVPQLQDLRFVLCPRTLDEYQFWMIYFTLCRRYLPKEAFESGADPVAAAAAAGGAAAGPGSTHGSPARDAGGRMLGGAGAGAGTSSSGTGLAAAGAAGAAAVGAAVAAAAAAAAAQSEDDDYKEAAGGGSDSLADLAADPELDAYLQEALAVGGGSDGGDGSGDSGDLDDYINALEGDDGDDSD